MVYYRCKCGNREVWSSMGVDPCCKCKKCGTKPATGPNSHEDPQPHDFRPVPVETNDGTSYLDRCFWCMKTRKQVEKEECQDHATIVEQEGSRGGHAHP